ncbi:MAG TPA: hypothetical protein VFU79_08225 [Nitrososphaeraceae archaeon]|nr:hypothetical protein [Nitrososphaeraceae archaeon]
MIIAVIVDRSAKWPKMHKIVLFVKISQWLNAPFRVTIIMQPTDLRYNNMIRENSLEKVT